MMFLIARRVLRSPLRLAVTVVGVVFAVMLILVQLGMFLGFMASASVLIDHSAADIWIGSKNSSNVEWSRPIPERFVNKVRSTPGVARAESLRFAWSAVRLPGGGTEKVEVIGYHPEAGPGWGGPWGFTEGSPWSVVGGDYVVIDESSEKILGQLRIGQRLEVLGKEIQIVGRTRGIRSVTTAPFFFTSYETAPKLAPDEYRSGMTFVLVQALPGADIKALVASLSERLPFADVMTREDYSRRAGRYWAIHTGLGLGFLLTAGLGFVVGLVIVGQTVYADTMKSIVDFATLRALGTTPWELVALLWSESLVVAGLGYVGGGIMTIAMAGVLDSLQLSILVPPWLWSVVAVTTILMCCGASAVSIRKVISVDPAIVFSGRGA